MSKHMAPRIWRILLQIIHANKQYLLQALKFFDIPIALYSYCIDVRYSSYGSSLIRTPERSGLLTKQASMW